MISVIVPVYNGRELLSQAFASIEEQRHPDLEVIVVDDGSTDGLAECVGQFPPAARYLRQQNRGPAAARNLGIQAARGDMIAFLDADDRWTPGHLERLEQALLQKPDAGVAQGRMQQFVYSADGSEHRSGPYRMPHLGSCLYRRWVFERYGLLDESMRYGEDYDFMCRCWEWDIPKCLVADVSLLYRRHAGNMTRGVHSEAHVIVLKRRLDRIRAGVLDPSKPKSTIFQEYIGETREFDQWSP